MFLWSRIVMRTQDKTRALVTVVLLALTVSACNRSAPTITPAIPLPTLAPPVPSPSPTTKPTLLPTLTAATDSTETSTPAPSPTPVIPSACPPPGDPTAPDRPASFADYPGVMAAYLSAGGSAGRLERLLRDWQAVTDEAGAIRSLDMTGDMDPEIVVALIDPLPAVDRPWSPGEVLIFQCRGGAVVPAYQGRMAIEQEPEAYEFMLRQVEDVNGTGRADVVYVTSACGASTCWERLYVVEWDGAGFVNRVPDMADYAYPTFTVGDGRIQVEVGGIGSAGAGYQRSYRETWEWDGRQFIVTQQLVGPPTALVHTLHDGDDALLRGDYGQAIGRYRAALDDSSLPVGLFLETEELGRAVVSAYARFKLVVAFAASGDGWGAQSQYELLMAEHPDGTPGSPYALLGQAFWIDFVANDSPGSACAVAVGSAESNPTLAEQLYAGYANPEYEPADLCRMDE
jgi:hypothetical protein